MTDQRIETRGPSVFAIAAGVAIGVLVVLAVVWAIISASTANDGFDCAAENVDRANQGLPVRDCG